MDAETAKKVNEMASSLRKRGVCATMQEAVERAKKILLKSDEIKTPDINLNTSMSVNEAAGVMKKKEAIIEKKSGKKHSIDDEEIENGWVHDDEYHKTEESDEKKAEPIEEEQPDEMEKEPDDKTEPEEEQPDDDTEDEIEPEEEQEEGQDEKYPEEPEPDTDDDAQKEVFTNIPEGQQQGIGFEDDDSNADEEDESLEDSDLKELDSDVKNTKKSRTGYDNGDTESPEILSEIDKEIEEEEPEDKGIDHGYTNDEDIIVKTLSEIFEEEQENGDEENPEEQEEE
ncbi:MAG: hypothetical protein V1740_05450 [Candidatus Woesearchaeota archaeon]